MYKKIGLFLSILITSVVFFTTNSDAIASSDEFALSITSGKPGTQFALWSNNPCPTVPDGKEAQVRFQLTDSAGHVTGLYGEPIIKNGGALITPNADGSWKANMIVPYKTVDQYLNYSDDAARGVAHIDITCGYENGEYPYGFVATKQYSTRTFQVTGKSQSYKVASKFVQQGKLVSILRAQPCPSPTSISVTIGNWSYQIASYEISIAKANWRQITIPIPEDAKGGIYSIEVKCHSINDSHSLYYAQQPLLVANNYLALGDSYASGEGAPSPNYMRGTDIKDNRCHRSQGAYSQLVRNVFSIPYGTFRACSGATIGDFYTQNQANSGEPAQIDFINDSTNLITFNIGGNDIGFADVMDYCVKRSAWQELCEKKYNNKVTSGIEQLASMDPNKLLTLRSLYGKIRQKATNTYIVAVGYPRLFPKNPPKSCGTGWLGHNFVKSDMEWMNKTADKLNNAIKEAAIDQGITYLDVNTAFEGHEVCTRDAYINKAVLSIHKAGQKQSYHPNKKGQRAEAALIEERLRTLE